MKGEKYGDILKKDRLKFKTNKELEKYYEKKYSEGGYKKGYTLFGVNISNIFHKERHKTSLKLLNPNKNEVILDAGCGDGTLALKIAKKSKLVYAVDISKSAFKKNKKIAPKNLFFEKGNIEKLRFKDNTFDKIVCVETLEHLINPNKALNEFYRILKKGGRIVVTYPTIDETIVAKIEKFFGIRDKTPVSEHLTEWDYNKVIKEIRKKKFKFIKAKGIVFDLGRAGKIKKSSKRIMKIILKFTTSVKNHPRNSMFVAFEFEK